MVLPLVEFSEYTPQDAAILRHWWKDEAVQRFLGPLTRQLQESILGMSMPGGGRIARPNVRLMVHDSSGRPVGFVSVQVTGQGESPAGPIGPPFHAGVNLVVAPGRRRGGLGTAILAALHTHPLLAEMATFGGVVDEANSGSRGMTAKAGLPEGIKDGRGSRRFTVPGPAHSTLAGSRSATTPYGASGETAGPPAVR